MNCRLLVPVRDPPCRRGPTAPIAAAGLGSGRDARSDLVTHQRRLTRRFTAGSFLLMRPTRAGSSGAGGLSWTSDENLSDPRCSPQAWVAARQREDHFLYCIWFVRSCGLVWPRLRCSRRPRIYSLRDSSLACRNSAQLPRTSSAPSSLLEFREKFAVASDGTAWVVSFNGYSSGNGAIATATYHVCCGRHRTRLPPLGVSASAAIALTVCCVDRVGSGGRTADRAQRAGSRGVGEVSEARNQKSEARSQKPEIRSQKPENRSQKEAGFGTRNPEPRTQNPEPETQNPEPETRNSKSSEARGRASGLFLFLAVF